MYKQSFQVDEHKKQNFKKGDIVRLIDGSSLTSVGFNGFVDTHIVNSYPNITGIEKELKYIDAIIIESNIKNHFCTGVVGIGYIQDVLIQIGKGLFRCNSTHIKKATEV